MEKTCPKCAHGLVAAARGALQCPGCSGIFVPSQLVPYIDEEGGAPAAATEHDALGGRCPNDRTILSRAEIEAGPDRTPIHLERCSSCRGIWFDRGEWSLLADQQLLENIDQFWTAEWRARQRRARNERDYDRRLREEFGPALYAELEAIATRLKGHERRSQALAFLKDASAERD